MELPIIIRPETLQDYATIAGIHARAFDYRASEALIVALHRQRKEFDPELSLVAIMDGIVVGHALFSPQTVHLLGYTVKAVCLGPIAVEPSYQKRGIGGKLMNEGHAIARSKDYLLSFLVGHPSYYPRFGYQTGAYGAASITVATADLPPGDLETRVPIEADIPSLRQLWQREESRVDFAIDPGTSFLDWISPNPAIRSTVYLRGEQVIGYTRVHNTEPLRPRVFLAHDRTSALAITAKLVRFAHMPGDLALPLHANTASAEAFGIPSCEAWEAGMAYELAASPFEEYYARLQAGEIVPGRPIWPVTFDVE